MLRTIGNAALDLLYPGDLYCICCGKMIDHTRTYRLCDDCMDEIRWAGTRTCDKCGKPLSDFNPGGTCFSCREHSHVFDSGYTCTSYASCERAIIFALKYGNRTDIADTIGEIMYDRMMAEFTSEELREMYDLVLPVPVHRHKRALRGYNQAELIARAFARRAGLSVDTNILLRTRETHVMRSLTPDQRRENIRGAFAVRERRRPDISGRNILVVDDIYTTGATIDEIASILKAPGDLPGASRVDSLVFSAGADIVK